MVIGTQICPARKGQHRSNGTSVFDEAELSGLMNSMFSDTPSRRQFAQVHSSADQG